jgi:hypothetical protein
MAISKSEKPQLPARRLDNFEKAGCRLHLGDFESNFGVTGGHLQIS